MKQSEPKVYPYTNEPIKECSACGTKIYFVIVTKKDGNPSKPIPVNQSNNQAHWASCPAADKFRKPR